MFILAAIFALFALLMWFSFLRPVPRETAAGVITKKTFKPAGTYTQYPGGDRSSFYTPAKIPIAEAYIFTIQLTDPPRVAYFVLNTVGSEGFAIGQKVRIEYEMRGFPLMAKRYLVFNMTHADGQ